MQDPLQIWYGPLLNEAILQLPRIEFSLEGAPKMPWAFLMDELMRITGDLPGLWPQKPWFDANGNGEFPLGNEQLTQSDWENRFNQDQLKRYDPSLVIPTSLGAQELASVFTTGNPKQASFVNQLQNGVKTTRWLLYAVNEDVLLFLTAREHAEWVCQLHDSLARHDVSAVFFCTCPIHFSSECLPK